MDGTAFIRGVQNGRQIDPDEPVFDVMLEEYSRVIFESLLSAFWLDRLLFNDHFGTQDRHGGDVDTIHNVRKIGGHPEMVYKKDQNQASYDNRGEYNSASYHSDSRYKEINKQNAQAKKQGILKDTYTGKTFARNAKMNLDHVISAKEIHDDPGRVLAGLKGEDLANSSVNLKPTSETINKSMGKDNIETYLAKQAQKSPARQEEIANLKGKGKLTDQERKKLEKLETLESMDPKRMRKANEQARKQYESKLATAYYTSKQFTIDTTKVAVSRGAQMGIRQALGFVLAEISFCAIGELKSAPPGSDLPDLLKRAADGIKKGVYNVKTKFKDVLAKVAESFGAGALSSLTTTITNIFFTTAKNLVKCIRQIYASVVQAGRVLLFNPDNLRLGDRIKAVSVILSTGASVLLGTAVGELVSDTPIGSAPVLGEIVTAFCSTMVSGLLSCTLLIFLDRSKFINTLIDAMNSIPSEVGNYKEIADAMEALAARIANLDINRFKEECARYDTFAVKIGQCDDEEELNCLLLDTYQALGIKIPWTGDFDSFMGNRNNRLVFE